LPNKKALADPRILLKQPALPQIVACKAVFQGTATEDQQRRFVAWLIHEVCAFGENHAYFGEDAALKTYLALGRRRVAEILQTYVETPIERFKDGEKSEQVR